VQATAPATERPARYIARRRGSGDGDTAVSHPAAGRGQQLLHDWLGVALQQPMPLLPLPMLLLLTDSLLDRTELCGHCKSKSICNFELKNCKDCLKLLICFNDQYSTSDYSYKKYCKIMCKTW
jgi:hypothetical protein